MKFAALVRNGTINFCQRITSKQKYKWICGNFNDKFILVAYNQN